MTVICVVLAKLRVKTAEFELASPSLDSHQ